MFGYIKPNYPYLYMKDDTLYRALYCGMCKSIKKANGNIARFSLTYDIAFMSLLVHAIKGVDVEIKNSKCVAHCIKKRPMAKSDDISLLLADVNLILAKYKVADDIVDEKKGKIKGLFVNKGYKKAVKRHAKIDEIVKNQYSLLTRFEKENHSSIDMVSDCFAKMLEEISTYVLGGFANENTKLLFYTIGKWVYLIDALDDYDKDVKKSNYNVFRALFNEKDYKSLIQNHYEQIVSIFSSIFSQMTESYQNIQFKFNKDLSSNIIFRGIPNQTKTIIEKGKENNGK